ncbi:MAG TPA: TolC family protein [Kofleriaceae bacterium]|nr:TolC family protein [Kofleriaceae bacterium]
MRAILVIAAVAAPAVAAAQPAAAPASGERVTRLGLGAAVELALGKSPDLSISEESVETARHRVKASQRRRLPTVSVESIATYWDKELSFAIAPPMPGVPPEELVVRERLTTASSATAVLPLSAQLVLNHLVAADKSGMRASEQDHAARRLEVATSVASAYLGVLLARATNEIAQSRTELVQAQLERARVLREGGVLGQVDVMRLEAALAAARRQAIASTADAATAEDALILAIGLPEGTRLQLVDELPAQVTAAPMSPDEAVRQAVQRRPELRAARARADQARSGARVLLADLFPNVSALGTVQHNTGNGPFQPENAWFVGVRLSWNVWDWGSNWHTYKAASHQADQASKAASRMAEGLRVEVRRRARQARAAFDALDVARAGLAAAEEAFRIQEARYQEGATTTTELLAAETEVAEARIGHATARHAYFLELAALARATGQLPDALLPTGNR